MASLPWLLHEQDYTWQSEHTQQRVSLWRRCVCMPQVDEAVEFIIDETFQVAGMSYLDCRP